MDTSKKLDKYPKGEFMRVVDTIGVPHPYCITPKHVAWASDHWGGMLSKEAIVEAEEKNRARCGICKGKLSYEEHETALLVAIDRECELRFLSTEDEEKLRAYLKSILKMAEEDNYAGFAFIKESDVKEDKNEFQKA